MNSTEILKIGINTIRLESASLENLCSLLDDNFANVVKTVLASKGRVVVTGIGKSAIIGQKMVATFNSTGTPSLFMHAADAIHGDLGMIQQDDTVICISKSGNSPEIKTLVPLILRGENKLVGITGNLYSYLAELAHFVLNTTVEEEACPNNLAPTTSTTAQMAMGDALAVALIKCRDFRSDDFAKYHPGGSLGKKLYLTLDDVAKKNDIKVVEKTTPLAECIIAISQGRIGAVIVQEYDKVIGIITDGDLRRMLSARSEIGGVCAQDIMTHKPRMVESTTLAVEGIKFVKEHSINHIIIHNDGRLVGVVHIQDLVKEGLT